MSIELITRGGKKVGELSDDASGSDKLVIKGKQVNLEDVYSSDDLTDKFNTQVKELNDDTTEDDDSTGTSE